MTDLTERLRTCHQQINGPQLVSPDGPDGANEIETLNERNKQLTIDLEIALARNEESSIENDFTGLFDTSGKKIMHGDIIFWDDESNGEWSRIARVEWNRPKLCFICIACVSETALVVGHGFNYGNFVWADSKKYITIVGSIEAGLQMAKSLRERAK